MSATTLEVPGLINRSTFARADGSVVRNSGSTLVNHRTPLLERWGGMYVTGTYTTTPYTGRKEHMGNVTMGGDPADWPDFVERSVHRVAQQRRSRHAAIHLTTATSRR